MCTFVVKNISSKMNLIKISKCVGMGIARPHKVKIIKWFVFHSISMSYKDDDAVPFCLYKKQGEPWLITGKGNETHAQLLSRIKHTSHGDDEILLEGRLWRKRSSIVFKDQFLQMDIVCLLHKMLFEYENINISNYIIYSEKGSKVYSTTYTNMYAEESLLNIERAVKEAIRHGIHPSRAEDYVKDCGYRCFCRKFLPGVIRWFGEEEGINISMVIKAIEDTPYEYDGNFNGLPYIEFADLISDKIMALKHRLQKKIGNIEKCRYDIIQIPDFETCQKYRGTANWCILDYESDYETYTDEGQIFYFCKIKQQEYLNEIKEFVMYNRPYSLTFLAVQVNTFGFIDSVTDLDNNLMNLDEISLSQLVGVNFFDYFKPREIS